eukprot:325949-Hanusia_phi.AAC.2
MESFELLDISVSMLSDSMFFSTRKQSRSGNRWQSPPCKVSVRASRLRQLSNSSNALSMYCFEDSTLQASSPLRLEVESVKIHSILGMISDRSSSSWYNSAPSPSVLIERQKFERSSQKELRTSLDRPPRMLQTMKELRRSERAKTISLIGCLSSGRSLISRTYRRTSTPSEDLAENGWVHIDMITSSSCASLASTYSLLAPDSDRSVRIKMSLCTGSGYIAQERSSEQGRENVRDRDLKIIANRQISSEEWRTGGRQGTNLGIAEYAH